MRKEVLLLSLIFLLIVHAGIVIAAFEEGGYSGYINGALVVCGDGICDDIEKDIGCSGVYLFDDGEKHDICFLSTCPIDCGRTLGEYVGEGIDAPICGDGICEGVEDKKICKYLDRIGTDFCVPSCTKEDLCQPACLSDCGIIARIAPQDYDLPIEIKNIIDPNPGIGYSSDGEITQISPYRPVWFYRFEDIQTSKECEEKKRRECLLGVNNEGIELGILRPESFFSWFRILFGLSQYKVYEIPYYESLKIKVEGSEKLGWQTYKEYIPIFDSLVQIEYSEGIPPRSILTNESCINDLIDKYNFGKMPNNCSIEELSEKSFLSEYSRDELAWLSYRCVQYKIVQMERQGEIVIDESGIDFCHEFRSVKYSGSASEIFNCLYGSGRESCANVLELDVAAAGPEEMFSQEELEEARDCYKKCDIDMDCAIDEKYSCVSEGKESSMDCLINALIECEI